jgi:HPt (histidine-containing phosphotransfer) domain-containing protein
MKINVQDLGQVWLPPSYLIELLQSDERQAGIELIELLVVDTESKLSGLRLAFEQGQTDEIRRLAHGLKGSCGQMGVNTMAILAGELEATPSTGLLARMELEFSHVRAAIDGLVAG